jgi:hypothetical protein
MRFIFDLGICEYFMDTQFTRITGNFRQNNPHYFPFMEVVFLESITGKKYLLLKTVGFNSVAKKACALLLIMD